MLWLLPYELWWDRTDMGPDRVKFARCRWHGSDWSDCIAYTSSLQGTYAPPPCLHSHHLICKGLGQLPLRPPLYLHGATTIARLSVTLSRLVHILCMTVTKQQGRLCSLTSTTFVSVTRNAYTLLYSYDTININYLVTGFRGGFLSHGFKGSNAK